MTHPIIEAAGTDTADADRQITAADVAGSAYTYRHDWGPRNGPWILHLNDPGITGASRVFVSIGEGGPEGKVVGSARYTLHNVAPGPGRVSIWVDIDWESPIRLLVDYLIVQP